MQDDDPTRLRFRGGQCRLITNSPLTEFARYCRAVRPTLKTVWLISPWITGASPRTALQIIIRQFHRTFADLFVVTRPPNPTEREQPTDHAMAVELLKAVPRSMIVFVPRLHAKLYIAVNSRQRLAVFGSPNLTVAGDRGNVELAVEVRSSAAYDELGRLHDALLMFAQQLLVEGDLEKAPNIKGQNLIPNSVLLRR